MAAVKKIAEAIKSIPGKKESLRNSLEVVRSYSSSLATFTLEWKDLEDHLSTIVKSIDERFKALEAKEETLSLLGKSNNTGTNKNDKFSIPKKEEEEEEEVSPRPELKSLCVRMDAKGLAAFMEKIGSEGVNVLRKELLPALRFAPDPAELVVNAIGFHAYGAGDAPISNWRSCINLLEALQMVGPEVGPATREKALMRASEWKAKISFDKGGGDHSLEVIAFLQLVASFDIVANFDHEDVLEIFSIVSRRKQAQVLVKNLGLIDNLPELFQKLSSKGRQLDAVKIIYAYDMAEKFPPVPLLEAYVKESNKRAEEIQKRGENSRESQSKATAMKIDSLKSVIKAIKDYKLENEYPCQDLQRRISELEQRKPNKKRDAAGASVSISKLENEHPCQNLEKGISEQEQRKPNKKRDAACASVSISKNRQQKKQQQQQSKSNKRSRRLATPPVHAMPANPYPPSIQNYPQHGHYASYMAEPYGLTASGSVYNHVGPNLSGTLTGHCGARSPPRPYLYSSEALAGATGRLYDRSLAYGGYPPSYGSSMYP